MPTEDWQSRSRSTLAVAIAFSVGSINIDDQLGILVQKEMVGQHARGQIGSGGQLLKLTAINGSIRLAKQ